MMRIQMVGIQMVFLIRTGGQMTKKAWLLLVALAFAAGCATEEAAKPAPAPEPTFTRSGVGRLSAISSSVTWEVFLFVCDAEPTGAHA